MLHHFAGGDFLDPAVNGAVTYNELHSAQSLAF